MTLQEAMDEAARLRAEHHCSDTAKRSILLLEEIERLRTELQNGDAEEERFVEPNARPGRDR